METTVNSAFHIVGKNLNRTTLAIARAAEKSFSHLKEQAELISRKIVSETGQEDIICAVLTADDAARIYREGLIFFEQNDFFGAANHEDEPFFRRQLSRFSKFYLCDAIAKTGMPKTLAELAPMLCGNISESPKGRERTVAFLRNGQASRAFECFAKSLGGVSAVYENNFLSACESVYTGASTYAIIPIYSTADGRLNSFYRQIEKYELSIVFTCEIDSDDGENTTIFALVYKDHLFLEADGLPLYECKITFDDLNAIADITDAAAYYGVTIESLEALPVMFSGRTNAFAVVFGLQYADIEGFFCYLALEYPQTATVSIYQKL